ncbi:MAG TPA: hypothetical protein VG097_14945 [Gemmata sp.]|nr:hypothetical protein [Gemmata sp.]
MFQKSLGVICIVTCILAGCFIAVLSVVALVDGEEDPILVGYFSGGVILIFAGLFIMHRMTQSDAEPRKSEDWEDQEW